MRHFADGRESPVTRCVIAGSKLASQSILDEIEFDHHMPETETSGLRLRFHHYRHCINAVRPSVVAVVAPLEVVPRDAAVPPSEVVRPDVTAPPLEVAPPGVTARQPEAVLPVETVRRLEVAPAGVVFLLPGAERQLAAVRRGAAHPACRTSEVAWLSAVPFLPRVARRGAAQSQAELVVVFLSPAARSEGQIEAGVFQVRHERELAPAELPRQAFGEFPGSPACRGLVPHGSSAPGNRSCFG